MTTEPKRKPPLPPPEFVYIEEATKLHEAVHTLRQQPVWAKRTIDTETTGLLPFVHRLKVIQIGVESLPVFVIQIERVPQSEWGPLREYFSEPRPNILQNAKFDFKMLEAEGLPLTGAVTDTLIRSKVYHLGNHITKHKLKALTEYWTDFSLDKTEQSSFVADESREPLSLEQQRYAAKDIAATQKVEAKLTAAIEDRQRRRPGIVPHVSTEEAFLLVLAKLENQGVLINLEAIAALTSAIGSKMAALEAQLAPVLQPNLRQLKLNLGIKPAFVPSKLSDEQIKASFGLADTDTRTLLRATQKQPLIKLLLEHEALWRQLDSCKELTKKQNAATGKWHADHNQIENLQGTLGPSKLKLELIERLAESWHGPLALLKPEAGCQFLNVTFPDLELVLLAHYAEEPLLLEEVQTGKAPIMLLANAIAEAGLSVEPYRNAMLAKGLWWGTGILHKRGIYLQEWLLSEFGLIVTTAQTKALQTFITQQHKALTAFHEAVSGSDFLRRATILGALRYWDKSNAIDVRNFIIWSSYSEILKLAAVALQTCCKASDSRVAFIGERDLLLEVPQEKAATLTQAVLEVLVEVFSQRCPQITIGIEVTTMPN